MPRKNSKRQGTISVARSPSTQGAKKTPNTASVYNVCAKDVINLKFVQCKEDVENRGGFFRPVYTHQLFDKERILGYKDLKINIFFTQPHLYTYVDVKYSDKLNENEFEVSDITATFSKWLKGGFTQNKHEFIKSIDTPFYPPGKLHCEYCRPDLMDVSDSESIGSIDTISNDSRNEDDDFDDEASNDGYYGKKKKKNGFNDEYENEDDDDDEDDDNNDSNVGNRNGKASRRTIHNTSSNKRVTGKRKRNNNDANNENDNNDNGSSNKDKNNNNNDNSDEIHVLQPRKKQKLSHGCGINGVSNSNSNSKSNTNSKANKNDNNNNNGNNDKTSFMGGMKTKRDKNEKLHRSRCKREFVDKDGKSRIEETMYEIRVASFADEAMTDFHSRLQFFVLLYIESSSYIDHCDEVWEVMVLFKRQDIRDAKHDDDDNDDDSESDQDMNSKTKGKTIGERLKRRLRKSEQNISNDKNKSEDNSNNNNENDNDNNEDDNYDLFGISSSSGESSDDENDSSGNNENENENEENDKKKRSDDEEEEDSDIDLETRSKKKKNVNKSNRRLRNHNKSKRKKSNDNDNENEKENENDSDDDMKEDKSMKGVIRRKYETLGYMTLYRFFAWPDGRRLRVSQVIIFPPFQRQKHGYELLQHVYLMGKYRDFVEVNIEDPAPGFQLLRDVCDVYNCYQLNVFDENDFNINSVSQYYIKYAADNPKNQYANHSIHSMNGNNGNSNDNNGNNEMFGISHGSASMSMLAHVGVDHDNPLIRSHSMPDLHNGDGNENDNSNNNNNDKNNSSRASRHGNSLVHSSSTGFSHVRLSRNKYKPDRSKVKLYASGDYWNHRYKLPSDIYHDAVIHAAKVLKITPEQARRAYECLKLESVNMNDGYAVTGYRLDMKRRLLAYIQDVSCLRSSFFIEGVQSYDEMAIRARLQQLFLENQSRYQTILQKRDKLMKSLPSWKENHFYPQWLKKDYRRFKRRNKQLLKKKSKRATNNNNGNNNNSNNNNNNNSNNNRRSKTKQLSKSKNRNNSERINTRQLNKRPTRNRR